MAVKDLRAKVFRRKVSFTQRQVAEMLFNFLASSIIRNFSATENLLVINSGLTPGNTEGFAFTSGDGEEGHSFFLLLGLFV